MSPPVQALSAARNAVHRERLMHVNYEALLATNVKRDSRGEALRQQETS